MKRTTLNAWQMVAIERALHTAINRGEITRTGGGEALLVLITNSKRITVTSNNA